MLCAMPVCVNVAVRFRSILLSHVQINLSMSLIACISCGILSKIQFLICDQNGLIIVIR